MAGSKSKEWVIRAHLETAKRRGRLADSILRPAQERLDFVLVKKRRWAEGGYGIQPFLKNMKLIATALDNTEVFDRASFFEIMKGLQAIHDEQLAARKQLKPVTRTCYDLILDDDWCKPEE